MATSRFYKLKLWMSENAKSKPAQFLVTIASGASLGGTFYWVFDMLFAALSGGNTYVALKVVNALLSSTIFVVTAALASEQIEVSISTNAEMKNKMHRMEVKFNSMYDELKFIREYLSSKRSRNNVVQFDSIDPREDITPFQISQPEQTMQPLMASIEMKPLAQEAKATPANNTNVGEASNANQGADEVSIVVGPSTQPKGFGVEATPLGAFNFMAAQNQLREPLLKNEMTGTNMFRY